MEPSKNTQQHAKHTMSIAEKVIAGIYCIGFTIALFMWLNLL
jgi:hypothetical protein